MNTQYKIFNEPYIDNPTLLYKSGFTGPVFCSKKHKPFNTRGLYKIVHEGFDKRGKPFAIAEPVFAIGEGKFYLESLINVVISGTMFGMYSRNMVRFNYIYGYNIKHIVTIDDIIKAVKMDTVKVLNDQLSRPIVIPDMDFELEISEYARNKKYQHGDEVSIIYVNGIPEFHTASWVLKNREHLVNWEITVYGDKVENLYMMFTEVS